MARSDDMRSWRPAAGSAVRRANALGYCRTSVVGWALTYLVALPATALLLGWAYITDGTGFELSDLGYSVRRELRRIAGGQTRTLPLQTWFPERAGHKAASWEVSNEKTVVSNGTLSVALTSGDCLLTILSCPVTRFGRARATVDNGEITLGFKCRARDLELLARTLQWRPATAISSDRTGA